MSDGSDKTPAQLYDAIRCLLVDLVPASDDRTRHGLLEALDATISAYGSALLKHGHAMGLETGAWAARCRATAAAQDEALRQVLEGCTFVHVH